LTGAALQGKVSGIIILDCHINFMRASFRQIPAAVALAAALLCLAIPGETHSRRLKVTADDQCRVAASMPATVTALPRFSRALARGGRVRIIAIGSSSTEGVGASSPAANYPSQLRGLLAEALPRDEFEVLNLGVGGEMADKTAARLMRDAPELAPDLIIWQVGTNDAMNGRSTGDYEAILRKTLQFLKARKLDVVLVGLQWSSKLAESPLFAEVIGATARAARLEGVALVSRAEPMRLLAEASGREDMIGPDRLHLNDRGYRCMAEQVGVALARAVNVEATASGSL
jgi:acyl-CoA thioesterase I